MAWQTIVVKIAKTGTLAVTPSAISLRRTKLRKMYTGSISTVRKGGDASVSYKSRGFRFNRTTSVPYT